LSDFKHISNFSKDLNKNRQYQILRTPTHWQPNWYTRTDVRRTGMGN